MREKLQLMCNLCKSVLNLYNWGRNNKLKFMMNVIRQTVKILPLSNHDLKYGFKPWK